MSSIPHSYQVKASREHARLKDSKEESRREQSTVILDQTLHYCNESEEEHIQAEPDVWLEFLEKDV